MIRADLIERLALAAIAAGADVDPDDARRRFDEWLETPPASVTDPERWELKNALGLRT